MVRASRGQGIRFNFHWRKSPILAESHVIYLEGGNLVQGNADYPGKRI